jgi:hypothetical protein
MNIIALQIFLVIALEREEATVCSVLDDGVMQFVFVEDAIQTSNKAIEHWSDVVYPNVLQLGQDLGSVRKAL